MDMDRPPRPPRRHRALPLAIATALLLALAGAASAGAYSGIEGVWSFEHGQIAIQPSSSGTYQGIVVVETKFAECAHPVGQEIWSDMTEQPDGSYWGLHQWYFANSGCTLNPTLGKAAWRVLEGTGGSHYLRVCLSEPGSASQPTIAANGSNSGATYGCIDSALTAELPQGPGETPPGAPGSGKGESGKSGSGTSGSGTAGSGVAGSKETLTLPSAKQCLSVRLFKIHLADPKYDPFKSVSVTLKGRRIATVRKGKYVIATIDLGGLPKGAFTVKIKATTVLGHHLSASRTYHTCIPRIKPKKSSKRKSGKKG